MDRHSEVEAKFNASGVSLKEYHRFIAHLSAEFGCLNSNTYYVEGYKAVVGTDTYYDLNGSKLRYREGDMPGGELTYKERKSDKSIADRVEINLPLKETVSPHDVHAMMTLLGGKKVFSIRKNSYIYHLQGKMEQLTYEQGDRNYVAVVALYDVIDEDDIERRFLEVEIEASSSCSAETGRKALDKWVRLIKNNLAVEGPLNQSLFEIYSKGK